MITSAEEFYRLRTSEIKQEYDRAAHDHAPLEIWIEIITKFPEMRFWVAHNKNVPIEVLEILSRDDDPKVRSCVASKRKLPENIQLLLTQDEEYIVRDSLVWNAKAKNSVLRILAKDMELEISEKAKNKLNETA